MKLLLFVIVVALGIFAFMKVKESRLQKAVEEAQAAEQAEAQAVASLHPATPAPTPAKPGGWMFDNNGGTSLDQKPAAAPHRPASPAPTPAKPGAWMFDNSGTSLDKKPQR